MAIAQSLLQLFTKGAHPHGGQQRNGSYGAEDTVGGRRVSKKKRAECPFFVYRLMG